MCTLVHIARYLHNITSANALNCIQISNVAHADRVSQNIDLSLKVTLLWTNERAL